MAENQQKLVNVFKPKGEANNRLQKLQKRYRLTDVQKLTFYRILKHFLKEPNSLQDGQWDQVNYFHETLEFVYGKRNCYISVMNFNGQISQEGVVATLDIYLKWREVENASLSNLQRVQNELRFLGSGFLDADVDACFFQAKLELTQRSSCSVQILCDDVVLHFSAEGKNEIVVMYDKKKNTPICSVLRKGE